MTHLRLLRSIWTASEGPLPLHHIQKYRLQWIPPVGQVGMSRYLLRGPGLTLSLATLWICCILVWCRVWGPFGGPLMGHVTPSAVDKLFWGEGAPQLSSAQQRMGVP